MTGVTFQVVIDGKAAEMTVEKTSNALAMIFGRAAHELGLTWGEQVAFYRLRKSLEIRAKTVALLEQYPVPPEHAREVGEGEGLRALDAASVEEEPAVQDLWAKLIRNARDARTNVTIEKAFVDILRSLSGPEAIFLEALDGAKKRLAEREAARRGWFEALDSLDRRTARPSPTDEEIIRELVEIFDLKWRGIDMELKKFSIQNLIRQTLISPIIESRSKNLLPRTFTPGSVFGVRTAPGEIDGVQALELSVRALTEFSKDVDRRIEMIVGTAEPVIPETPELPVRPTNFALNNYLPEMQYIFLPLGTRLMNACSTPT